MKRVARLGSRIRVVFGASEYVAPIPLRLFHSEGTRFRAVAYSVVPCPEGGTLWTPRPPDEAELHEIGRHIPSAVTVGEGAAALIEVSPSDFAVLLETARPMKAGRPSPWPPRCPGQSSTS